MSPTARCPSQLGVRQSPVPPVPFAVALSASPILCGAPSLGPWSPELPWKVPEEIHCSPGETGSQQWHQTHLEARGTSPVALPVSGADQLVGGSLRECFGVCGLMAGRREIKLTLENSGTVALEGTERPRKTVPRPEQAGRHCCGLQGRLGATAQGTRPLGCTFLPCEPRARGGAGARQPGDRHGGRPALATCTSGHCRLSCWCTRAWRCVVAPGLRASGLFLRLSDLGGLPRPLSPGGLWLDGSAPS